MSKQKKTIKKNYTGGQSIKYGGDNPAPKTPKDIQKVYDKAEEGSAFFIPPVPNPEETPFE